MRLDGAETAADHEEKLVAQHLTDLSADFATIGRRGDAAQPQAREAVQTIRESGLTIFLVGVIVTIVPLLITMVFGRYVLRYDNVAIFAGALSGSRSANPAFGEVLNKAENAVPTVPFAITYALANVFLTLLGPLIVAFA